MSRDVVHGHECKTFSRQREKREGCVMSKIPLPPLPHWNEEMYRQQIRARDQEIVRCVLEAAVNASALVAAQSPISKRAVECVEAIRALEFTHHE